LLEYNRNNVPEISTESPFEPSIQQLRSFALIGHLCNTLTDMAAHEGYIGTANIRESVVRLLALLDFHPTADIPSTVDLRAELVSSFTVDTLIVPDNSRFSTQRQANTIPIVFEADAELTIKQTDILGAAWNYDSVGDLWTDRTTPSNTDSSTTLLTAALEGHFYLAHENVLTNTLDVSGITQALDLGDDRSGTPLVFHLQYFDGELEDARPDSVSVLPGGIRFDLDDLLGTDTKVGTDVVVQVNATGAAARLPVENDGTNFITTSGFLGQSTVSADASDYTVGTEWHDVEISTDTTADNPAVSGEIFESGDGGTTFSAALDRWPLEDTTVVTWTYPVGTVPTTATYNIETGVLGGDAAVGTTVNPLTGSATLVTTSTPDTASDNILVDYFRKSQTLQQDGQITFAVPFNELQDWNHGELDASLRGTTGPSLDGFWLRFVISSLGANATTDLIYDRIKWDEGQIFVRIPTTQGQTVSDEVLGSGDGTVSQEFFLAEAPVIEGSVDFFVDDELWTQVTNFFSSGSLDEHYLVEIDSDGVGLVKTGDGINGKIVPVGVNNVTTEYRISADLDGNVGSNQVRQNRTGLSRLRNITNPLPAAGWVQREGATEESLEKLKRDGVASLRVLERAVSPSDIEFLTRRFVDSSERVPYSRALAVENGFGLNTVKLIVVPVGGVVPSTIATRDELDLYFSGDLSTGGSEPGVLVVNHELTSVDYTPNDIDVTVTVTGGTRSALLAAMEASLQPEAVIVDEDTGAATFRWRFGQTVSLAALTGIFTAADSKVENVVFTSPATDVLLADDELPRLGTLLLTVLEP
jgi:hypothetical protein